MLLTCSDLLQKQTLELRKPVCTVVSRMKGESVRGAAVVVARKMLQDVHLQR